MKRLTIHVFAVVGTAVGLTLSIRPGAADPPKIITFQVPGSGTKALFRRCRGAWVWCC
jgi:hypothetical protein